MRCYVEGVKTDGEVKRDVKQLIPDAGMRRRMSRVVRSAVATAVECMAGIEEMTKLDAILTATGWGCLTDSERFLRNLIVEKEQLLNPTPFIQSTFNTVGGCIALLCGNHCSNVTYVNRSHSFEDALFDGALRLEDGESSNILVGAFDEQTATQHGIMERMGLFRKCKDGEGSVFMHIRGDRSSRTIAQLTLIEFPAGGLSPEQCIARYATRDGCQLIYNGYERYGLYPTSSARSIADAVSAVAQGATEVVVYNEYMGATPAVLRLACVGC